MPQKRKEPASEFEWQGAVGVLGIALGVGGMADMPIVLRVIAFISGAVCMCIAFAGQKFWAKSLRVWLCVGVSLLMVTLASIAVSKSLDTPPEDKVLAYIRSNDEQQKLLAQYPLGYIIFEVDSVTQAVTPLQAHQGFEGYEFNFNNVAILQNTEHRISIRLPSVLKDGQYVLSNPIISGDKITMLAYGAGYNFGKDRSNLCLVTGRVLQYNGYHDNQVVWILGISRMPAPSS